MPKYESPHYENDNVTYADCGRCEHREWCPLFLISIKPKIISLISDSNKNLDSAFSKAILFRNMSKEYTDGGVVSFIRALKDNELAPVISEEKGKRYLLSKLGEHGVINSLKELIVDEEGKR